MTRRELREYRDAHPQWEPDQIAPIVDDEEDREYVESLLPRGTITPVFQS